MIYDQPVLHETMPEGSPQLAAAHQAYDELVRTLPGVEHYKAKPDHSCYTISHAGHIVAILVFFEWTSEKALWIGTAWTHPNHRKQGLYKTLFLRLADRARGLNLDNLQCGIDPRNVGSHKTHASLGMEPSAIWMKYPVWGRGVFGSTPPA